MHILVAFKFGRRSHLDEIDIYPEEILRNEIINDLLRSGFEGLGFKSRHSSRGSLLTPDYEHHA